MRLVARALEKNPRDRFDGVSDLAEALRNAGRIESPRRRRVPFAYLALTIGLAAGAAAWWSSREAPAPTPSPPPPTAPAVEAPPPAPVEAPPAPVPRSAPAPRAPTKTVAPPPPPKSIGDNEAPIID